MGNSCAYVDFVHSDAISNSCCVHSEKRQSRPAQRDSVGPVQPPAFAAGDDVVKTQVKRMKEFLTVLTTIFVSEEGVSVWMKAG
eukprot:scaffold337_cov172-Amphora_coffeaeformis.AAC.15